MGNGPQHKEETKYMIQLFKKYLQPGAHVLEVGSGWGRLFLAITGSGVQVEYKMCDFVEKPRRMCEERTGVLPDLWDGDTLPYWPESFDLVVLFDVLLHVPPKNLKKFWREMLRVSRRFLFLASGKRGAWNQQPSPGSPAWCFNHEYKKLVTESATQIVEEKIWTRKRGIRINWLLEKEKICQ